MSTEQAHARAVRYRRLALIEADRDKATLLNRIADEAEQGLLHTVDRINGGPAALKLPIT